MESVPDQGSGSGRQDMLRPPRPLTRRQREVLLYIRDYSDRMQYPPSGREIAVACRLGSPSGAHRMLNVLERKGYIARSPGLSRSVHLVPTRQPSNLDVDGQLLAWANVAGHRLVRNAELVMATRLADGKIQAELIANALKRHNYTEEIVRSGVEVRPDLRAQIERIMEYGIRANLFGRSWPEFVISYVVLSRYSAPLVWSQCGLDPRYDISFHDSAMLLERSAAISQEWLDELLSHRYDDLVLETLRSHAQHAIDRLLKSSRKLDSISFSKPVSRASALARNDFPRSVHFDVTVLERSNTGSSDRLADVLLPELRTVA